MPVALSDGLQIVPGYRLEIRLGKGGFGEVWRATGPGKVPVALKIIEVKGSAAGDREFKSLDLVRDLRHPNLLPVQAYWMLDDDCQVIEDDRAPTTIVIAMLLGGKNLRQRLQECRAVGLAGIPPRELLEMMRDVAKGIDYLNKPIHQHGDLQKKPETISLEFEAERTATLRIFNANCRGSSTRPCRPGCCWRPGTRRWSCWHQGWARPQRRAPSCRPCGTR